MLKIMCFVIGLTVLLAVTVRTTVSLLDTQAEDGASASSSPTLREPPQPSLRQPTAPICEHAETTEETQTQLQVALHTRSSASVAN